ncbi:MAG: alpha/beta fold hydrolase [Pseudomonadota bacterium]
MSSRVGLIASSFASLLFISACASGPTVLLDATNALLDQGAGDETILFATVRSPSPDGHLGFSGARASTMSYGKVDVRVPPDRSLGEINYPSERVDLRRDFIARNLSLFSSDEALKSAIDGRVSRMPETTRGVSLFVHGFNTDFAEGIFLFAQMVRDFQAPGVPVHFSWASAGLPQGYLYDLESANIARDDLADTIRDLNDTRAEEIILVAHSMGGMVLMEALRQIGLQNDRPTLSRISAVVLAAPDIDIDVFEEQLRAIEPRPFPILVFASRRDPALRISSRLRGRQPRVGDGSAIERLVSSGIDVIDLTDIEGSRRDEHNKFAHSPFVINMIRQAEAVREALDTNPQETIEIFENAIDVAGSTPSSTGAY